jgi:hypothetical protein
VTASVVFQLDHSNATASGLEERILDSAVSLETGTGLDWAVNVYHIGAKAWSV